MTFDQLFARCSAARARAPGRRVALDCGPAGAILFDGVAETVTRARDGADATIAITLADLEALMSGALDPDAAFVEGRLKVTGDLGAALSVAADLAGAA